MNKIKVAIVEDEFLISHDIRANLEEQGFEITGTYESGTEALAGIRRDVPDVILMDINIKGGIDGIETAEIIRQSWDLPIIYITAYTDSNTQERAKKTLPHAFIIKPFNFSLLNTTIDFAVYNYANNKLVELNEARLIPSVTDQEHLHKEAIFIKEKGRLVKVATKDFTYLLAKGSYCEIFTSDQKFTVSKNLQTILEKLKSNLFIRVHRSYAVNINMIDAIDENELLLGEVRIPLSKSAKSELLERISSI